jgi:hypothetical protein
MGDFFSEMVLPFPMTGYDQNFTVPPKINVSAQTLLSTEVPGIGPSGLLI